MIAVVVDRTTVDGIEWIRVQFGADRLGDLPQYGWAPAEADVRRSGGDVHVDPVYEYVEPTCPPGPPTIAQVGGMPPLLVVHCFGTQEITVSPAQARNLGADNPSQIGGPDWLATGTGLFLEWLPDRIEMGAVPIYIDPASGIAVDGHVWIEARGRYDHSAARQCTRGEALDPEWQFASDAEAVNVCRGRFVVTGVRQLSEAEIPPVPTVATPGPVPDRRAPVAVNQIRGPLNSRIEAASVWTGAELIVWGGAERGDAGIFGGFRETRTGAAYEPATGGWRSIADGPLSARLDPLSTWTGTEMLVWGGYRDEGGRLSDGAAYNPATNSWRRLADGPLAWRHESDGAWTGTEWWVAVEPPSGAVRLAAYDPSTDRWRELPTPDGATDETDLVWADGTAVLMTVEGLYTLGPSDADWSVEAVDFHGPIVWADGILFGNRWGNLDVVDPFGWDPWSYPIAWDLQSHEEIAIALPPGSAFGGVWTGSHLAFFESGLTFEPASDLWSYLDVQEPDELRMWRDDAATAWTGDRLIVWGGWSGCFSIDPEYDIGYELVPDWSVLSSAPAMAMTSLAHGSSPSHSGPPAREVALAC